GAGGAGGRGRRGGWAGTEPSRPQRPGGPPCRGAVLPSSGASAASAGTTEFSRTVVGTRRVATSAFAAAVPNPYMASDVNRRTANGGRFFLLPGFSPDCCCPLRLRLHGGRPARGVSPRLHQTLLRGSAAPPLSAARRLRGLAPRPGNSSVPPRRPLKTVGSRPEAVPVRSWL